MANIILVLQMLVSTALIGIVLIQSRGTGLGRTFGASSTSFSRRGLDKLINRLTFVLVAIFIGISILAII